MGDLWKTTARTWPKGNINYIVGCVETSTGGDEATANLPLTNHSRCNAPLVMEKSIGVQMMLPTCEKQQAIL